MNSPKPFLLLIALLSIVIVLGCNTEQPEQLTGTAPFFADFEQGQAKAAEKDQNLLIDFYTDW